MSQDEVEASLMTSSLSPSPSSANNMASTVGSSRERVAKSKHWHPIMSQNHLRQYLTSLFPLHYILLNSEKANGDCYAHTLDLPPMPGLICFS